MFEETTAPPKSTREGGLRGGAYDAVLRKIKDEGLVDRWFKIGRYGRRSSGQGAVATLQGKYGKDASCQGWTFVVRKDEELSTPDNEAFVLYTHYDPTKVVEGANEAWTSEFKAREKEKNEKYKANAAAKKAAEKAAGDGGAAAKTADESGEAQKAAGNGGKAKQTAAASKS